MLWFVDFAIQFFRKNQLKANKKNGLIVLFVD